MSKELSGFRDVTKTAAQIRKMQADERRANEAADAAERAAKKQAARQSKK